MINQALNSIFGDFGRKIIFIFWQKKIIFFLFVKNSQFFNQKQFNTLSCRIYNFI